MYKYYQEVESDDHYCYAHELAKYMHEEFGISSPDGDKPAVGLMTAMLNYIHEGEPKLYYNTRYGLKRVWPRGMKAMILLVHNCVAPGGRIEINGKKYRYKRKSM